MSADKPEPDIWPVTSKDLARLLGLTRARLSQLRSEEGMPKPLARNKYDAIEQVAWLVGYWKARALERDTGSIPSAPDDDDPDSSMSEGEAKRRKAVVDFRTKELDYHERLGELIPREDITGAVGSVITLARQNLQTLPARLGVRTHGADSPEHAEQIIREEVHQVLTEIAEAPRLVAAVTDPE